ARNGSAHAIDLSCTATEQLRLEGQIARLPESERSRYLPAAQGLAARVNAFHQRAVNLEGRLEGVEEQNRQAMLAARPTMGARLIDAQRRVENREPELVARVRGGDYEATLRLNKAAWQEFLTKFPAMQVDLDRRLWRDSAHQAAAARAAQMQFDALNPIEGQQ